ncbi:MAG: FapA family protein [Lachnospiraceae bacterium]|nr:FapA family protein [Lachnospiraceae bacterium]
MNGYFKLITKETQTGVLLYAPTEGGAPIDLKELTAYLERFKVPYDIKALNDAMQQLREGFTYVRCTDTKMLPVAETCSIYLVDNRMKAIARFYPASDGGRTLDAEGVRSELRLNRIVPQGFKEDVIENYVNDKKYCYSYILAEGQPPREGSDAEITYNFDVNKISHPKLNEDGTVDYFDLGLVNHCHAGDVLATLKPADKGDPGYDLLGNVIKPRDVKRLNLTHGLNIELNEDKTVMISKIDGHVTCVNGKVFVNNVLELENVDVSTGNIEYQGNVIVNNNVINNFSVKAHGDIEVRGVVEGAYLEADGNITLTRGVNGMNRGILKAGGNVVAKFVENCTIIAGGSVMTDSILLSNVQAKNEVIVQSSKGFITGGTVQATNSVKVKNLGSAMGAGTNIIVGIDPLVSARYKELEKEIETADSNLKKIAPALAASKAKLASGARMMPDQLKTLQQLAETSKSLKEQIEASTQELEKLQEMLEASTDASVEVTGTVFGGTSITISDQYMVVKDNFQYCRFTKQNGTVKMNSM